MSKRDAFKVIVVGGGPAGLTLAQCLSAAKIDYVLFERRPHVVEMSGSGFGITPENSRVLDQLGLLSKATSLSCSTGDMVQVGPNGRVVARLPIMPKLEETFGYPYVMLNRTQCCELLYESLPDKDRIIAGKRVTAVEQSPDSAKVVFDDGSVEEGDVVIACDGIYSTARKAIDTQPLKPIQAEYRCLYGMSTPLPPGKGSGEFHVALGQGASAQCFTVNDRADWILYEKLPSATSERVRYTEDEERAFAQKYLDKLIDERGVTFGDLWERCTRARAAVLEEGIFTKWYQGRVVLVGDAAHKLTPNLAQGYNNSVQDAVSLTNQLHKLITAGFSKNGNEEGAITVEEIEKAFAIYQDERFDDAKRDLQASGVNTRIATWDSLVLKWLPRIMLNIMPQSLILEGVYKRTKTGLALTCMEYPKHDGMRFNDEDDGPKSDTRSPMMTGFLVVSAVGVLGLGYWLGTAPS